MASESTYAGLVTVDELLGDLVLPALQAQSQFSQHCLVTPVRLTSDTVRIRKTPMLNAQEASSETEDYTYSADDVWSESSIAITLSMLRQLTKHTQKQLDIRGVNEDELLTEKINALQAKADALFFGQFADSASNVNFATPGAVSASGIRSAKWLIMDSIGQVPAGNFHAVLPAGAISALEGELFTNGNANVNNFSVKGAPQKAGTVQGVDVYLAQLATASNAKKGCIFLPKVTFVAGISDQVFTPQSNTVGDQMYVKGAHIYFGAETAYSGAACSITVSGY